MRVRVFDVPSHPSVLPDADLVIDAAYGTGFHGTWDPPDVGDTPVLAVDVPSGVDALTGDIAGDVLAATHTVTFAALKPGLLMPPGSALGRCARAGRHRARHRLGASEPRARRGHRRLVAGARRVRAQVAERAASHRRQLDHDRRAAIGCARGDAHRRRDGAPVGPRHDAGRGADRDRPAIAVEHGLGRRRVGVARALSCRRRRSRARSIGRHRSERAQARPRGAVADGARWRRVVRAGLELRGRDCVAAPPIGANGADASRRRVRVAVG